MPLLAAALALAACSSDSPRIVDVDGDDAATTLKTQEYPTGRGAPARASRFDQLNALEVSVSPRRAAAVMAVVGAAPGTLVRSITGANPDNCSVQTGIAFDGTNLLMSCWYTQTLDVLRPSDGSLVKRLRVPSISGGFFAMAWDGAKNRLWACVSHNRVYVIDTSDPNGDGVVEAGEVEYKYDVANQCTDGLAFDGADRTLWVSGDVYSHVAHHNEAGVELARYPITSILGVGNSGIAAGGGNLYLANNGSQQIYVTNKPPTSGTLFATFPRRIEDLECDDVTFRNDGISVIWQQDAYDREVQAYAIEPGACPFGGFEVPQATMDVQPGRISVASSPVANVVLISNALFDATTVNLANVRLVVDGDEADGARIARRGAAYVTSTRDWNGDGLMDRLVAFTMADLRAAGLTAGETDIVVQDVTSASGQFQARDTVLPEIVP